MEVLVERLEYRVLRGQDCVEVHRLGGFAFTFGLVSLGLGGLLRLLGHPGSVLSWLFVVCGVLLMVRGLFPERPWRFGQGRVRGPGLDCPYSQVGMPGLSQFSMGQTQLHLLSLPVPGGSRRLVTDTQIAPLELLRDELECLLRGRTGEFDPSPGQDGLDLRRILAGGTLLGLGLLITPLAFWGAPDLEFEGVRVWVLGLSPLWAGFWESAGRPVLPPARGPLVWGNYAYITVLVLVGWLCF
ncbi:MAG: hypothetical protein U0931_08860 [Vulcanimicrobiota bacterium]